MMRLELVGKPVLGIAIGGGKEAIKALVDEKYGYTEPLQNVADHVAGTLPFALGVVNMFMWKSPYGDVALGAGGGFLGEAIAKLVRKYTGSMAHSGLRLELETAGISPMPNPQVSSVDSIHGVVV